MSEFVVSARKYRPATFATVVGQENITGTLKNALKSKHLAQAFLFCGPRGVGKTTCARILAKTINCFNINSDTEACNNCESCASFNEGQSLNIYELDAASNNSVDDIRSLIEQVRFAPQLGKYKVYIIDEVHMLSTQAFNAFLKTLEEPPAHAIFILATTEKHKIIPTILSRCQIFDFNRIQVSDIARHLAFIAEKENVKADPEALHVIAQKADGALRDACSIFDQIVSFAGSEVSYEAVLNNLNILDHDYYFKIVDEILAGSIPNALNLFNEILNKGFDGHHFLTGLSGHFRNLMVSKDPATVALLETSENVKQKFLQQAARLEALFILKALDNLNKADQGYKASRNQRLLVELSLMQLAALKSPELMSSEKKNDSGELNPEKKEQEIKTEAQIPVPKIEKAPVGNSRIPSSHSIASLLKGKKEPKMAEPVSTAELESAWEKYALAVREKNQINLAATLLNRKPVLKGETQIEFTLDNKVQEEMIQEEKTDLMSFLRKELKNSLLSLETRIERVESEKKPYTPSEKFSRMAQANPALHKLKQAFDLDIEY
jgi:DNA polymerase III subunit gamma/tau